MNLQELESKIENVANFPKPGVNFKDISPLLRYHFNETIDHLCQLFPHNDYDAIAGIESRGFIIASALAYKNNKGLILVRKKGKLPPQVLSQHYQLEYGSDTLEIKSPQNAARVLIADDIIATGGTLGATIDLCEKAGLTPMGAVGVMSLSFLLKKKISIPVKELFRY